MFVILKNGKRDDVPSWARVTFYTVNQAIEAVRLLEFNLNRLVDHSPYTIMPLEAN